jgi:hypothetical protein
VAAKTFLNERKASFFRGGAHSRVGATDVNKESSSSYTAVGVIPSSFLDHVAILSLPTVLQPACQDKDGCCLVVLKGEHDDSNSTPLISTLPRNADMIQTLSMTCHVLVLFLSSSEISLNPEIIQSILEGARRRRRLAGHDKLQLLVVLAGITTDNENDLQTSLALHELQDVAPQDFDVFEMTTLEELNRVWQGLAVQNHEETSELIDEEGLAKLIETIYESLSKQKCTVQLKAWNGRKLDVGYKSVLQQVMTLAQPRLEKLESKQQDVWLNQEAVPMLEFGAEANDILQQAVDTIDACEPPLSNDDRLEI